MTYHIELQNVSTCFTIPKHQQICEWISAVLISADSPNSNAEITVRVVEKLESATLNEHYRKKHGPTNILSFPISTIENNHGLVGDLVICAPLLIEEAQAQGKTIEAHWAHLLIHGTLHLLGYDHQNNKDTTVMEAKEIAILSKLGYPNPYLIYPL